MRHEAPIGQPHHNHSLGIGAIALDGLLDEVVQVAHVIHVGVEVVATGISGVPPPLHEPVHSPVGGEQEVLVLVHAVVQPHVHGVLRTPPAVAMQSHNEGQRTVVVMPPRHYEGRASVRGAQRCVGMLGCVCYWSPVVRFKALGGIIQFRLPNDQE